MIQSLVRLMPDLHKTLLLASLVKESDGTYTVKELAMTTEHAPFRHKHAERLRQATQVGTQRKRQYPSDSPNNKDRATKSEESST